MVIRTLLGKRHLLGYFQGFTHIRETMVSSPSGAHASLCEARRRGQLLEDVVRVMGKASGLAGSRVPFIALPPGPSWTPTPAPRHHHWTGKRFAEPDAGVLGSVDTRSSRQSASPLAQMGARRTLTGPKYYHGSLVIVRIELLQTRGDRVNGLDQTGGGNLK